MDTVARQETEDLVLGVLRAPALAEGVELRLLVGHRPLNVVIDLLVQIVIGSGHVERQLDHPTRVEQVAANEVQRDAAGLARQQLPSRCQFAQRVDDRMVKVGVDQILQLRGLQLGGDVHGNPVVGLLVDHVNLVVRVPAGAEAAIDRASLEDAIALEWHDSVLLSWFASRAAARCTAAPAERLPTVPFCAIHWTCT